MARIAKIILAQAWMGEVGRGRIAAGAGWRRPVWWSLALRRAEPFLRARIVEALEDRFHARVELDSFHLSLVKGLWAEGKGLRIWPPAQVDGVTVPQGQGEPLIRLEEFRFHAPLRYRPGVPIRYFRGGVEGAERSSAAEVASG